MSVPKEKRHRLVFDLLFEKPHIPLWQIREALMMKSIDKLMKKVFDLQHIVGPEMRRKAHEKIKEFMYFIKCEDPESLYLELRKDQRVSFHAGMSGFCDVWVIAREEIEIEGDTIVQGVRSDFYVSKPPDHSWEDALRIMKTKIDEFDPENYTPKGYIQTHWDETIEWDEKDELLFRYFKYNLRRPLSPILEKHLVSAERLYQWFAKLPQCCTVCTSYFPEGFSSYESHLYLFETDYEDFIVEVFSELPSTSTFFKVSDEFFTTFMCPNVLYGALI